MRHIYSLRPAVEQKAVKFVENPKRKREEVVSEILQQTKGIEWLDEPEDADVLDSNWKSSKLQSILIFIYKVK